jgi:hypothetical protein
MKIHNKHNRTVIRLDVDTDIRKKKYTFYLVEEFSNAKRKEFSPIHKKCPY